jgi:hypothetical protein
MQIKDKEKLTLPGTWIDHPDRDWASSVQMLLDEVLDQLSEAHLILAMFEASNMTVSKVNDQNNRLRLIYAKSFVYALDTVCQLIRVLQKQEQLPSLASDYCQKFLAQFGGLRDLRNSLQHVEDRLRGIDRKGEPIPSSLLVLGAFRDNNYFGATVSDGRYVEIEISDSVLIQAYSIVEELLWCFDWLGPGNIRVERPDSDA